MKTTFITSSVFAVSQAAAIVGTNIGGWQVLEPWITPSLFYRFLGKTHSEGVGVDQYSFCEALGPEEGNAVLRAHWDAWITEEHIKELSEKNVEIARLPIGDWTLKPYGPYVGCTEGAKESIQWFLDTAQKYGLKVLLDVHAVKDSQNGFDNSGWARETVWWAEDRFDHWGNQSADWIGDWNKETQSYDNINQDNIDWALDTVDGLLEEWGDHPAVYAIEPVNEPWGNTPRDTLMDFYRSVRNLMKEKQPRLKFVFQNAFDFSESWNSMFDDDDHENVIMDAHYYIAWSWKMDTIQDYCNLYEKDMPVAKKIKYDVWVGEWSLATDVCAMWLAGFNDTGTSPQFDCNWVDCPYSYLPEEHAVDFDRTAAEIGPFGGSDVSGVKQGKCPSDSLNFSSDDVHYLAQCALDAFDENVQGHFLWTFRNELEPRWNYVTSYDNGWTQRSAATFLQ